MGPWGVFWVQWFEKPLDILDCPRQGSTWRWGAGDREAGRARGTP